MNKVMNKAMNGVLYTIDGEVLCEFPEFKIGNKQYKDKTYHKMVLLQSMRRTDRI